MYLIGFAFATWLANRRANKSNGLWTQQDVSELLFAAFLGIMLGGRIGYVVFYHLDLFLEDPFYLFRVWKGGMSFHGGLIGVAIATFWYARKNGRKFSEVTDFIVPLVPFGSRDGTARQLHQR